MKGPTTVLYYGTLAGHTDQLQDTVLQDHANFPSEIVSYSRLHVYLPKMIFFKCFDVDKWLKYFSVMLR